MKHLSYRAKLFLVIGTLKIILQGNSCFFPPSTRFNYLGFAPVLLYTPNMFFWKYSRNSMPFSDFPFKSKSYNNILVLVQNSLLLFLNKSNHLHYLVNNIKQIGSQYKKEGFYVYKSIHVTIHCSSH